MASNNLTLSVYDPETLVRLGQISSWLSLSWEEEYRDTGSLQLEVCETPHLFSLLSEGRYVGLSGSDTLMIIHTRRIRDKKLVVNGEGVLSVLALRAVWGKIAEGTAAEEAIRALVSAMEPWPRLSLGSAAGLADVTTEEVTGSDVLSVAKKAAEQIDAGLRVRHDSAQKQLFFEVYKPGLAETKYSTLYGNVASWERTLSTLAYRNVARVYGEEAEDGSRPMVIVGDTEAFGAARREMLVDASALWRKTGETEDDYLARLKTRGEEALADAAMEDHVTIAVADQAVRVGELLPVILPEIGVQASVRVASIRITAQRSELLREITCGTPTIVRRA